MRGNVICLSFLSQPNSKETTSLKYTRFLFATNSLKLSENATVISVATMLLCGLLKTIKATDAIEEDIVLKDKSNHPRRQAESE